MKALTIALVLLLSVPAFAARTPIRPPTQEEIDAARGFEKWKQEREVLFRLFGLRLPKRCSLTIYDGSKKFDLVCPALTECDIPGSPCEDE